VIEARGAGAAAIRLPLDPGGWRPIRRNQRERGRRYDGDGVARKIRLQAGKLRVSAQANDLGVPLGDDPTPLRLRLRHGERNFCFTFGGTVRQRTGRQLVARNAPALEACPATPLAP